MKQDKGQKEGKRRGEGEGVKKTGGEDEKSSKDKILDTLKARGVGGARIINSKRHRHIRVRRPSRMTKKNGTPQ